MLRFVLVAVVLSAAVAGAVVTQSRDDVDLSVLHRDGDGAAFFRPYDRLAEMLPNALGPSAQAATDSAVLGTVTDVVEKDGYDETGQGPTTGNPGALIVGFDDDRADWRTLAVTIAVKETLAGPPASTLRFDWPVMGSSRAGDDASSITRALHALESVVVLSREQPDGPEFLGISRTLPDPQYGLIQVAEDGSLTYPTLRPEAATGSDLRRFVDGVDTLKELRTLASRSPYSYETTRSTP